MFIEIVFLKLQTIVVSHVVPSPKVFCSQPVLLELASSAYTSPLLLLRFLILCILKLAAIYFLEFYQFKRPALVK